MKSTPYQSECRQSVFGKGFITICALLFVFSLSDKAQAQGQWTTPDANNSISNTNAGNVGIGTTTPKTKLDVDTDGISSFTGTTPGTFSVGGNGINYYFPFDFRNTDSATYPYPLARIAMQFTTVGSYLSFGTSNCYGCGVTNKAMTIDPNGSIGIGTTSPLGKLNVLSGSGNVLDVSSATYLGVNGQAGNPYNNSQITYGVVGASSAGGMSSGTHYGVYGYASGTQYGYNESATIVGVRGHADSPAYASSTFPLTAGGYFSATAATGAGTPNSPRIYGVYSKVRASTANGAVSYGVYIDTNNGTTGAGTFNYGLYQADTMAANYVAGKLGIGTASPAYKLDVSGDANVTGTITGGNIVAKYQDVAEWVPTSKKLAAATVVVLDTTQSNYVTASSRAYDTKVAGVISERPGIALGESGIGKVLVATTGRVKVRVDATRAPIHVGDLLVTSTVEGYAMKSMPLSLSGVEIHRPGTLIGKALEPLDKGTGEILVLLSLQ